MTVDETFDNDHRVYNIKGGSTGKFTFSAADSGDHRICFTPSHPGAGGWLSGGQPVGGIKMTLDMAIGETSTIESSDKGKISEIVQKVRDLNARLQDIRREQVFQRVSRYIHTAGAIPWVRTDTFYHVGEGSRIQRSVGDNECQGGQMDAASARGFGSYLRLAAVAFKSLFHKAEADLGTFGLNTLLVFTLRAGKLG